MDLPQPIRASATKPPEQSAAAEVPFPVHFGAVLAWLGVCVSFLLLQAETGLRSYFCPVQSGCETVLKSPFASVRGIPLPLLGAAFYVLLLGGWLVVSAISSLRARLRVLDGILWLLLAGFTFSAGLMYVQFAVLHAFCHLCTASALTVAASLATVVPARRAVASGAAGASPKSALAMALLAAFPLLIFLAGHLAEPPKSPASIRLLDFSAAHRLGPADARVQMVVYSDFQCGFCRELAPVLRRLQAEFPQDVAIVFRHFPLPAHPRSLPAAIAAECAGEQGKFWEYHDKLFVEGGDLEELRLIALAVSLGLDEARFTTCLRSPRPRQEVDASLREAAALELPGAPAVFLNGRRLEGALTYERLLPKIQELRRDQPSREPPR